MKKDITRFWKAFAIVLVALVVVDFSFGFVTDKVLEQLPDYNIANGRLVKENYRLHRMDAEIVIIGSSRGAHHYVTQQLNDSIDNYLGSHYTVYNASIGGKFANSNSCAAEVIVSRYRPRLVIFDMPENQLRSSDLSDFEQDAPFYRQDSIVRRYFNDIGFKERIVKQSSMVCYNGMLLNLVASFFRKVPTNDGYEPLHGATIDTTSLDKQRAEVTDQKLYPYSETNFVNVLRTYQTRGIPLVVTCSPRFRTADDNQQLARLCKDNGIPFIEIYNDEYFNQHPELFRDISHLNDGGAHQFTAKFFGELKPYLELLR